MAASPYSSLICCHRHTHWPGLLRRLLFPCVCSREAGGPRPTVITPHGGPHSAYMAQYFMPLTYLVSLGGCLLLAGGRVGGRVIGVSGRLAAGCIQSWSKLRLHTQQHPLQRSTRMACLPACLPAGYNVVLLNFRGSTGFGEASIQSLPGRIGENDVADCLASLQAAVDAGRGAAGSGGQWRACKSCRSACVHTSAPCSLCYSWRRPCCPPTPPANLQALPTRGVWR